MKKQLIESAVIKMFAEIPQERGELDLDEIKKISEDIDINSALNKINRSVAGRDYFLRGINADVGEDKIEKVMEIFSKIKFNRIFNEALEARLYGYSTFEIIYDLDFSIKSLVPIPQKNISYDSTNKKWEIKIGSSKIDLDYQKFMHCIHRWTPAKVTGKSIMDVCNASFTDKTSLERQLRGLAKKYGDVITIFGYDPGEEEDKVKERADNLKDMHGKTAIGVPVEGLGVVEGADISKAVHFIKLSDLDPEIYGRLIKNEKLKLIQNILGSTLTMEVGSVGSQALGIVHLEAEEQVIEECCAFISDSLQNLLNAVLPLHGIEPKDFYFSLEKKRDVIAELEVEAKTEAVQTQRIDNIAKMAQAGYPLTKEFVSEYLGLDIAQIDDVKEFAWKGRKVR